LESWIQVASSPSVARRAAKVSAVIGTILIAINHGDALLRGDLDLVRVVKCCLTYTVPYMVSTYASTSAIVELRDENNSDV
jgi:hypothetical protein